MTFANGIPVPTARQPRVTVLAGGVGGAKITHGLQRVGVALTVIVNTGDDVELHGLAISPDIDTVTYTLADMVNPSTGWGVADDTFNTLEALTRLGEDTWFRLGDVDLATHIARTARLRSGHTLSQVTADFARALGIGVRILPMTDDRVATMVDTPSGRLSFQEYFVARRHADAVIGLEYRGASSAAPAPGVLEAIRESDVLVIAPSNPLLSIAPILAVPGVRDAVAGHPRTIAVSPLVGGRALKGPAADVLASMGHDPSAVGVARYYGGLIDTMCIDRVDEAYAPGVEKVGMRTLVTDTVMDDGPGRERLARELLAAA